LKTVGQHNVADITAAMGATGSGKSMFVKGELIRTKPSRLMVWDFKREYGKFATPVTRLSDVLSMARAEHFVIVFQPSHAPAIGKDQFDVFCQIAFAAKRLTFVGEELSFTTSAGFAPAGWSMLTLAGRSEALTIYGTSQRPACIDKNFFSNCTRIRSGRLNFEDDIRTMARVLKVKPDQVDTLLPLHYIERDMNTQKTTSGKVKIIPKRYL
jgi:hypothetical protein